MRLSDEYRRSLAAKADSYQQSLAEDSSEAAEQARSYLLGRGLSTQDVFSLKLGLVNGKFDDHHDYIGRICFPYDTKLGGVVALKFRVAHDCTDVCLHAKYITPYETRIYNPLALDRADQLGYVCICEGEVDTATIWRLIGLPGEYPAVGIPGTETWAKHPEWKELFRGYQRVYVFEDQDQENKKGEKAGEKLSKQILHDIDTAILVKLPGKDVNDTYRRFGPNVIKERIHA